jgi:magnesium chelatase subunit D
VTEADVTLAAQLVFAGRATQLPSVEQQTEKTPDSTETAPEPTDSGVAQATHSERDDDEDESADPDSRDERVLEATRAAIPPQLMQQLRFPAAGRGAARSSAKSSARRRPARRGRRIGTRPGDPDTGSQINLVETLRAAAPWQRIRRAESAGSRATEMPAIRLRKEDFRINRYEQRAATTSIFTVDASGSSALHRLAEVKGAVELLLAESYQRRDQVALVAFRGQGAELLLPPTRSLVRAKRSLAGLPGGGGTPLAAGIQLALETALGIRRKAETPVIILLTDGRGNVTLDGKADTQRAGDEAMEAARRVRMADITALLVDTSPRPRPMGKLLADAMGAHYLALPYADAHRLQKEASGILQDSSVRKR